MKRLIMMTSTQGKTPEQVAEELKAGLDAYQLAEGQSPAPRKEEVVADDLPEEP